MSHRVSSLAFDEVKESQDQIDLEPKLNLIIKSSMRNSLEITASTKDEVVMIEGRITVSF